ncbi:hypothetical protein [Patulibacter defluvii]|uniref:hypothetical protein n=1 Tax=Patulibacter defluvii TaxID=3095358 RepID=UPI002A76682C|nr:hypothetical protein [Patulibacter sp. DM4]
MRLAGRPSTPTILAAAALLVATLALVFAMTGVGRSAPSKPMPKAASTKPRPYGILRLDRRKRFPASVIPRVARAKRADRLGTLRATDLQLHCPAETVDFGTWCLASSTYPLDVADRGRNDFFFATQKCAQVGGYLPSAAQLIAAAPKLKISSTIDDNPTFAAVDEFPGDGLKDQREMSSSLITTTAGGSAAGSLGSTPGAKGDPRQGEPDPVPLPADPAPDRLQYITVYDNHDKGGFAGGKPVTSPERFRCAFNKQQGESEVED